MPPSYYQSSSNEFDQEDLQKEAAEVDLKEVSRIQGDSMGLHGNFHGDDNGT